MGSTTAAGTKIAISAVLPASQSVASYAARTYVTIAGVERLGSIGATVSKTEFEPLDGPKQKHKSSVDYGSLTPTIGYDNDDAGQSMLRAAAQPENNDQFAFRVTKPNGELRYFQARVFGFPETIANKQSVITAAPTIEICVPVMKHDPTSPPVAETPPAITGTPEVGQPFAYTAGTYEPSATSYSYRLLRNGVAVAGFNPANYVYVSADTGATLVLEEAASNQYGSATGVQVSAGVVVGSNAMLADIKSVSPTFAMGANVVSGQSVSFLRVRDAGGAQRDARTMAEATAGGFVPTKVVGLYDAVSNTLLSFSAANSLDLIEVDGKLGAQNNTAAAITADLPAAVKAAYRAAPGAFIYANVHGLSLAAPAANQNIVFISAGASTTAAKHVLRLESANGALSSIFRNADTDNASSRSITRTDTGYRPVAHRVNYAANSRKTYMWGMVCEEQTGAFVGSDPSGNVTPTTAQISIPPGATFMGAFGYAADPTDAEVKAWGQRLRRDNAFKLNDAIQSWWGDYAVKHPALDIVAVGFTMYNGYCGVAEIDIATGKIIDAKGFGGPDWLPDDHNEVQPIYFPDGSLVVWNTGHSNPTGRNTNPGLYQLMRSPTGRVADLGNRTAVPSWSTGCNYGQSFVQGSRAILFTNDDPSVSWFPFYSTDKGQSFSAGRALFHQSVAPGGGSNQVYALMSQVGPDALGFLVSPHASNLRNSLYYQEVTISTGVVKTGGYTAYAAGPGTSPDTTELPIIYTPPPGKSHRLMDWSDDGNRVYIAEYTNNDPADGTAAHYVLVYSGTGERGVAANWIKRSLGLCGVAFQASPVFYFPAIYESRETLAAGKRRAFRCTNDGTQNWKLDQIDTTNEWATIAATNTLFTASNSPLRKLTRCFSPRGADSRLAVIANTGLYNTYNANGWVSEMKMLASVSM